MITVVVGAGLSALAYKKSDCSALLIGDKKQGTTKPFFVWDTDSTRSFVDKLGIDYSEKEISVGYYYDNAIHDTVGPEHKKKYARKTNRPHKQVMCSENNKLKILELTTTLDLEISAQQVDYRNTVTDIRKNTVVIDSGNYVYYKKLVSTIPLDTLCYLLGKPEYTESLFYSPVYGMKTITRTTDLSGHSIVYDCTDSPVTRISADGYLSEEQNVTEVLVESKQRLESYNVLGKKKHLFSVGCNCRGHIGGYVPKELKQLLRKMNIYCLGRYAQWDYSIRLQDVVARAKEIRGTRKNLNTI